MKQMFRAHRSIDGRAASGLRRAAFAACLVLGPLSVIAATSDVASAAVLWGPAKVVHGVGGSGGWTALSCPSAGNCTAIGASSRGPIASNESGGVWALASVPPNAPPLLLALDCTAPGDCTAVGATSSGQGAAAAMSESNGSWSAPDYLTDAVPGPNYDELTAVSCQDASDCTAVGTDVNGYPIAATETSGVWSDVSVVSGPVTSVTGLSCTDDADCTAVGQAENQQPMVLTEQSGSWGAPYSLYALTGSGVLNAVTCTDAFDCTAVGTDGQPTYATETAGDWGMVSELSDVNPGTLTAVTCTDAADCTAVGNDGQAMYATETSGGWSAANDLSSSGTAPGLTGVSCSDATDCVAVGATDTEYDSGAPVEVAESSGNWGAIEPESFVGFGQFMSVSCSDASDCSAVGADGNGDGLVDTETAGTWGTAEEIASSGGLESVSCYSPGNCTAVGQSDAASYLTETDGSWSVSAPIPTLTGSESMYAVSCGDAADCTAVGVDGNGEPFAVSESAGTWAPPVELDAVGSGGTFTNVSCSDDDDCTAIGEDYGLQSIAATETGGSWGSTTEIAAPADSPNGADLSGIDCTAPGTCMAVGADYPSSTEPVYAVESGGTWGAMTELPGASAGGDLQSVSCDDALDCTAVGSDEGDNQPVYAGYSGGSWSDPVVLGISGGEGSFSAVSCVAVTTCTAVGGNQDEPIYASEANTGGRLTPVVTVQATGVPETGVVNYTVTVAGDRRALVPTGSVVLKDNEIPAASCTVQLVNSQGSCSLSEKFGTWAVTGRYSGDANWAPAAGSTSTNVRHASALTLAAPKSVVTGYDRYSVVVKGVPGSIPTGSVIVTDNASPPASCTAALNPKGDGACQLFEEASSGSVEISGSYAGDQRYGPSAGSVPVTANPAVAKVGVRTAGVPTAGSVTYTGSVGGIAGLDPSGSVTVTDGQGGSCNYTLGAGSDSCAIVEGAGSYQVVASYSGDANYASGASSPRSVTVARATPTLVLSASPSPAHRPGTVTYGVSIDTGSAGQATGTVTVTDGTGGSCSITLSASAGNCGIAEGVGDYTVSFAYGGDSNFNPATKTTTEKVS